MINDNTIVKVKVPKYLYEAIQKKLALKEAQENKDGKPESDKPKYAGMKMSKKDVLSSVGKGKQSRKVSGDKAKAYQPVHSRVYKEGENLEEGLMDLLLSVDMETLGMIATALGVTGGAKKLADMIKKEKADISGITGVKEAELQEIDPFTVGAVGVPALAYLFSRLLKGEAKEELAKALGKKPEELTPEEIKKAAQNAANGAARITGK